MLQLIKYVLFSCLLLQSANGLSQDTNTVALHIQFYNEGICRPLFPSIYYATSMDRQTKSVLQSGTYYSTVVVYVNSLDNAHLMPQANHQLQSSSLKFNPDLDYELVFLRYDGFDRNKPDSMFIKISKLNTDSQLILNFKKGNFTLKKMKLFQTLKTNAEPDFKSVERKDFKNTLKLDSTTYFSNGEKKANYYIASLNYPLYYVQEFDSVKPGCYAQGFRLLQNSNSPWATIGQAVWTNSGTTKYGYWEYVENGKCSKHELWASMPLEKYEWYASGQLKFAQFLGNTSQEQRYQYYLENGDLKEEYKSASATQPNLGGSIKTYGYSNQGKITIITTYKSSNGLTKQEIQKREIFYPSGQLKMEENYIGGYTIKYYNEDGTERIN